MELLWGLWVEAPVLKATTQPVRVAGFVIQGFGIWSFESASKSKALALSIALFRLPLAVTFKPNPYTVKP